jgi:hypothetical protein
LKIKHLALSQERLDHAETSAESANTGRNSVLLQRRLFGKWPSVLDRVFDLLSDPAGASVRIFNHIPTIKKTSNLPRSCTSTRESPARPAGERENEIFPPKKEIHGRLGTVHAMNFGRNLKYLEVRSDSGLPQGAPGTNYFN